MATEKISNFAQTTLNTTINNSTTTVVVVSATNFPSAGQFRISIENEIMLVTAVASTTFTVTRGVEGSTAVAHNSGILVTHIVTAGALNQIIADNYQSGAYASLPAAEKAGRIYQTTDSIFQFRDTGAAWNAYGPIRPCTPLASGDYTWLHQGGATADFTGGVMSLYTSTGNDYDIIYKAAPATPYTVTIQIEVWPCLNTNFNSVNMAFVNTGGAFSNLQVGFSSTIMGLWVEKWNAYNSYSGEYTNATYPASVSTTPNFLQLSDNGTTRYYKVSWDGFLWMTVHSVGRTDFLTPDAIGIALRTDTSAGLKAMAVYSWTET